MARVFGTLYLVAALVFVAAIFLPGKLNDPPLAAMAGFCVVMAGVYFLAYGRTPGWLFQLGVAAGSLLTAGGLLATPQGSDADFELFYVWVVLVSFLFFDFRAAIAQTIFALATFLAVAAVHDPTLSVNRVILLIAALGVTGAVVGLLRSRLERLANSLATQANTDPVTAIANRRSFESHFDEELTSADREGSRLSIVICDLDRFKVVNDKLGHEEGDRALRLAAETIASSVRSIDIVFRLGGEEFAVLLPNTDSSEAYAVAERIRGGIQDTFASYAVPVTASCGLATRVHATMNRKDLLRAADAALYHAKRNGRNRTMTHDPEFEGQSVEASSAK